VWLKQSAVLTYPSNNPGKLGKTGEKLGISAGALIRPVKEESKISRAVTQLHLYSRCFNISYCNLIIL
jgi:hypothetical protein